jgi:hypothetical protein
MAPEDDLEPRLPEQIAPLFDVSEGWNGLGQGYAAQLSVLSDVDPDFADPRPNPDGSDLAFLAPRSFRLHDLRRVTPDGSDDRRISAQAWTDYEAEYTDSDPGDAPFGQDEWITAKNRSMRYADGQGRTAIGPSHFRLIDSEDERYALALTMRELGTGDAPTGPPQPAPTDDAGGGLPPGVAPFEAGIQETDDGRRISRPSAGISIGGVTIFGQAAKDAALLALSKGGSIQDAQRWAIAASQGSTFPPLLDADPDPGQGRAEPPPADLNAQGSVAALDRPAGMVWTGKRSGLLGTVLTADGVAGSYFAGRDGTPIGPLAIRDDAQFSAGPEQVGRLHMRSDEDAAGIEFSTGKRFKGWINFDSSLANMDTEVGLETGQWPIVVPVDASVGPSKPPPPITGLPGGTGRKGDDGKEGKPGKDGVGGPAGSGSGGGQPREPEDEGPEDVTGGGGDPETPIRIGHDPVEGEDPAPAISLPGGQARDFNSPGVPCPNTTAGVNLPTLPGAITGAGLSGDRNFDLPPGIVVRPDGRTQDGYGYPAMTKTEGGWAVGGIEGFPFGLPGGKHGGFDVGPGGGDADKPGRIPLGLGGGPPKRGFSVDQAPDDGIPHRGEERARAQEKRIRRIRAEANRIEAENAGDADRKAEIDRLSGNQKYHEVDASDLREEGDEQGARRAERKARRAKKAREKAEKRDKRIKDKRQKRDDYRDKVKARKERRAEAKRERSRKRKEERRKRLEEKAGRLKEARRKLAEGADSSEPKGEPEGAWLVLTTPGEDPISIGDVPDDERSRFGDWNVANLPIPMFGSPDGFATLEDHVHAVTIHANAQQAIVNGLVGGPSYLASNIAVRHENRPGGLNPPAGSSIGSHVTGYPGEPIYGTPPAVELISIVEAQPGSTVTVGTVAGVAGTGGGTEDPDDDGPGWGAFNYVREFRGGGTIVDDRPLIVLVNDRGTDAISVGPMISGGGGRFVVDEDSGVTGSSVSVYGYPTDTGRIFVVGEGQPTNSGDHTAIPGTEWVYVDNSDGVLNTTQGFALQDGALATFYPEGTTATGVAFGYSSDGTLVIEETSGAITPTISIDGNGLYTGNLEVQGKLTVAGSIDPTDVQYTPQSACPFSAGNSGTWVSDGTVAGTSSGDLVYTTGDPQVHTVLGSGGGAVAKNVEVLYANASGGSTTSASYADILTHAMAAGELGTDGDALRISWSGYAAASTSGNLQISFGTSALFTVAVSTNHYVAGSLIVRRTGATSGITFGSIEDVGTSTTTAGTSTSKATNAAITATWANALTVKLRGFKAAGSAMFGVSLVIEKLNAS